MGKKLGWKNGKLTQKKIPVLGEASDLSKVVLLKPHLQFLEMYVAVHSEQLRWMYSDDSVIYRFIAHFFSRSAVSAGSLPAIEIDSSRTCATAAWQAVR